MCGTINQKDIDNTMLNNVTGTRLLHQYMPCDQGFTHRTPDEFMNNLVNIKNACDQKTLWPMIITFIHLVCNYIGDLHSHENRKKKS